MDALSTTFPTKCSLFKKGLCCQARDSSEALKALSIFIEQVNYKGELFFEASDHLGFRRKAKLAMGGTSQVPLIGLFKQGSHEIVDLECCLLHHEKIQKFIPVLRAWIKNFRIKPYDEKTHAGILRYVQLLVNDASQLQVALVLNQEIEHDLLLALAAQGNIHSLWINDQKQKTNTIFSDQWVLIYGPAFLSYHVMGQDFHFHPGAFCQSNLVFFECLLKDVEKFLYPMDKALDLYAGVGIFGLSFQKFFQKVHFVETNPFAEKSFKETIKHQDFSNGHYLVQDALLCFKNHLDADCVFVDPPRKGLHKEIKPFFGGLKKETLVVYISCGYQSLIRDLKEFYSMGFCLQFIKAYDCFPGSGEVEVLCILKLTT